MKYIKYILKHLGFLACFCIFCTFCVMYIFICNFNNDSYENEISLYINDIKTNFTGLQIENSQIADSIIKNTQNSGNAPDVLISYNQEPYSYVNDYALYDSNSEQFITTSGKIDQNLFLSALGIKPVSFNTALKMISENNLPWYSFTATAPNNKSKEQIITVFLHTNDFGITYTIISVSEKSKIFVPELDDKIQGTAFVNIGKNQTLQSNSAIAYDEFKKRPSNYTTITPSQTTYSNIENVDFCFIATKSSHFKYINRFLPSILLLILLLCILTIFIIRFIAKKMYLPIKSILNELPASKHKNSDELTYLHTSLKALIRKNKALNSLVDTYSPSITDNFMRELLTTQVSDRTIDENISNASISDIPFPLVVFYVDTKLQYSENLKDMLTSQIGNDIFLKVCQVTDNAYFCAVNTASYKEFEALIIPHLEMFDTKPIVIVGDIVSSFYDFGRAHSHITEILDRNIVSYGNMDIIYYKNIQESHDIIYTEADEQALISNVISCNTNELNKEVTRIIDFNMMDNLLSDNQHSLFVTSLYITLLNILTQVSRSEAEMFGDNPNIYLALKECTSCEELKKQYLKFLNVIAGHISQSRQSPEHISAQSMLSFIENNYMDDISLAALAEHLNMSQYYVSKMFKAYVGENFKDYLSKYRLEIAVKMLTNNPSLKLHTVAKEVGINPERLTRLFVKHYEMTPSEFIKKHITKNP